MILGQSREAWDGEAVDLRVGAAAAHETFGFHVPSGACQHRIALRLP